MADWHRSRSRRAAVWRSRCTTAQVWRSMLGVCVVAAVGDPDLVVYPRSCLKPMQAHAMLGIGLELTDAQLAIACASHDGSALHLDVVRSILARYGLDESDLANTAVAPAETPPPAPAHESPASSRRRCSRTVRASTLRCWPPVVSTVGRSTTTSHPITRCRQRSLRASSRSVPAVASHRRRRLRCADPCAHPA